MQRYGSGMHVLAGVSNAPLHMRTRVSLFKPDLESR